MEGCYSWGYGTILPGVVAKPLFLLGRVLSDSQIGTQREDGVVYWSRHCATGSWECLDPWGKEPASSHVDQGQMVLQEPTREPRLKQGLFWSRGW